MSSAAMTYWATLCSALWLTLCVTTNTASGSSDVPDWNEIFNNRNNDDWARVWHVERHRRCYQELHSHMQLVCEKDIYKLRRKRRHVPSEKETESSEMFLKPEAALGVLGGGSYKRKPARHRLRTRGIIDECCDVQAGCSWEEYAEYCPANIRIRNRKR